MTTPQTVAVTYVGAENPFKDRIYRTGLTFLPGQTRLVPPEIAARFLRHVDVFKPGEKESTEGTAKTAGKAIASSKADTSPIPVDDTGKLLAQNEQKKDEQREQDGARFALMDQIDAMDRKGVIEWAQDNYKQKIPANLSVAKAREMAKGFIDQYGMP